MRSDHREASNAKDMTSTTIYGARSRDLPITSEKVYRALREREQSSHKQGAGAQRPAGGLRGCPPLVLIK